MATPPRVRVAYVRRPVGLRGEVEVEPLTDTPERLRPGLRVHAAGTETTVDSVRGGDRGVVLRLAGADDRGAAEKLRGEYLEVDASDVAPLPEGRYYHWQLIGIRVRNRDRELGVIDDILEYPANDVYVVRGPQGEVLVPALASVVTAVDLEHRTMTVDLPDEEEVR
jgi:16S rRNA processing protein RimM